jgi:hypothetical protein
MSMRQTLFALMGVVCLTVPGMLGCSQKAPGDDGETLGSVSLPLVTSTPSATYRLTDATFTIDGPTPASLSSSDDPAEVELTAALASGSYEVLLEPGWALERDVGSGFVEVSATLLSGNPRSFTIQSSAITTLTYQFETDGTVVDTGDGQLAVDIQVDDSAAPNCTPLGTGCGSGSWCAPGYLGCVPIGTSAPGDGCLQQGDCQANSLCVPVESGGFFPIPLHECREICSAEQVGSVCPGSGLTCTGVGAPDVAECL